MDLVLVLLIGAAVGFSVGIYVARQYGASPKLEIWKREIIRDISSQLSQRSQELNNPDKALIKLSEGLVDKISQKLQEKLQAVQATLEEFKFRLADSQQSLLQDWGRDLLQAISVKLAEHGQQLNNQLAILENKSSGRGQRYLSATTGYYSKFSWIRDMPNCKSGLPE
jgi:gas vesicle protein